MKYFTAFCLAILFSLTLNANNGIDPASMTLTGVGSDEMLLRIESPLKKDIELTIQDQYGAVLYSDVLAAGSNVARQFDLKALPNGRYKLVFNDALYEDTYRFEVTTQGILASANGLERNYKPFLVTEKGITDLSYLNTERKKVNVTLFNADNQEIYTETLAAETVVSRRYNFRSLPKGAYYLVVQAGQDRVTHQLAL